jgi:hypothetical protein
MTFDLESGLMKLKNCDNYGDCDWGLFVILDDEEEENIQVNYMKMLLKRITQIDTIEEGECEYDTEETYGNKIEYYKHGDKNTTINLSEKKQDGLGNEYNMKEDEDEDEDKNEYNTKDDEDENEDEDYKNLVKDKIQFLITYMFTASVSMVLIILTFTI